MIYYFSIIPGIFMAYIPLGWFYTIEICAHQNMSAWKEMCTSDDSIVYRVSGET